MGGPQEVGLPMCHISVQKIVTAVTVYVHIKRISKLKWSKNISFKNLIKKYISLSII